MAQPSTTSIAETQGKLSAQSSAESLFSVADVSDFTPVDEKHVSKQPVGRTADGVLFDVPETHDMVRSLFDPTLRKSYAEVLIFLSLLCNIAIYKVLGTQQNRMVGFCVVYAFWRLAYNGGIGIILYSQSNRNSLVEFSKRHGLFTKEPKTLIQKLANLEIKSKMGKEFDVEKYPIEFCTWVLFRQFVDLILMQDFTSYMFLVYTSGQNSVFSQSASLNYTRIVLGSLMVLFNLWVKIDAHRVVKDYAWYWGDFFFLQESELIFDGVFNLSPHPMYSIGYIGYYGFALITKSYLVLIVSLIAHTLQFIFLNCVEEPHIIKTYGSDSHENVVEELEDNEYYLRPFTVFKNFNPIRLTDYLTVALAAYTIVTPLSVDPKNSNWTTFVFVTALVTKVVHALSVSLILQKQSSNKSWTKLYLKYGLDNVAAYSNWQVLYNVLLVLSYSSFFGVAARELLSGQYKAGSWLLLRIIVGGLLILLQIWTSSSIYSSIGDFGWFYGDFFLPAMSNKTLTKSGIYRYLNDPERLLGVAGIWGAVLITYSPYVFILAMVWTIHMSLHLAFVEKPHMIKVYGEQQVSKNISGVSLTLKQLLPSKLNNTIGNLYTNTFSRMDTYIKKRTQSEVIQRRPVVRRESISHTHGYSLSTVNLNSESTIEIGKPITVKWRAPVSHGPKDWIGLYQVLRTGSSRKITNIPSSGKWVAINPDAYGRSVGVVKEEERESEGVVSGLVEFSGEILSFEKGIYELRYHHNGSHKVLCISEPFEIIVPTIPVDAQLGDALFELIKRVYRVESVDAALNFKEVDPRCISDLVSSATSIDIASEVVVKLKTLANISARVIRSKKILDGLDKE